MSEPGIKYAALLFSTGRDPDGTTVRTLSPNVITWRGTLSEHIATNESGPWKEWLGSIKWDSMMKEQRIVLAHMPSERPEVIDDEGQRLAQRLEAARIAFVLAAPSSGCNSDTGFQQIGGQAASVELPVRLLSIRQAGKLQNVKRSLYRSREAFTDVWPWRDPDAWPDRWTDWVGKLDSAYQAGMPDLLDVGLAALCTALERDRLEFSIPEYVRAAECILGVPKKNGGAPVFAERALMIAPHLVQHWYVGASDLDARIRTLYQHRSDCLHGKVPFLDLRQQGKVGVDEAAKFEYLAEAIARSAISFALSNPQKFPDLRDRDKLEAAWANGTFLQP